MKRACKVAIFCLVVLALLSSLVVGCGGGGGGVVTTITVGWIQDLTGPSSGVQGDTIKCFNDWVRFINEEDPLPGAKIKLLLYDGMYDPSRDIPGYDYLRSHGAKVIIAQVPTSGDTLKSLAESDKTPIFSPSPSAYQINPPAWNFVCTAPSDIMMKALLKWISENDWSYTAQGREPKIGSVGYDETYHRDCTRGIEEYCQDHPDQFQYVADILEPMGTMFWSGAPAKLKDCDYILIPATGAGIGTFIEEFEGAGYHARFIGSDAQEFFRPLILSRVGWDAVDGTLCVLSEYWWNDTFPIVQQAKEILQRYHSAAEAADLMNSYGYLSNVPCVALLCAILRQAVKDVGARNFDGQAFYTAATKFREDLGEGVERWFSDTMRYSSHYAAVYRWRAADKDIIGVSGWLPVD
jgi:ABC-type branched-subunit amino acid transport system substrate-binding protein